MRQLTKFGLFFLLSSLLLGCSSKKEVVLQPTAELPSWYTNPPANDAQWLKGVGSGKDVQSATQEALNDMLAKLSVRVESQFSSEMSYSSHGFKETSKSQIRSEVANIRISNYEVVAAEKIRFDQYVVLIRSDRNRFIRSLADEISSGFKAIGHALTEAKNDNPIKRYRVTQQSLLDAKALMPAIWMVSGIASGFDAEGYRNYVLSLHSEQEQQRRNLVFYLSSSFDDQSLLQPIRNALTDEGFLVAKTRMVDLGDLVSIELKRESLYSEYSGIQVATVNITLDTKDGAGNVIGSKLLSVKGHATQGYELAESDAVNKFAALIEQEGIEKILGIGL
ncbi:LPP20 family lipoprotein [Oceanospirillum sanctuarii]|uniref:LPP20 family lipoprotein n=1 Tax=Oceanospirillum sanctuarii TaxID=1434821 RepID=UPI000A38885E|nr:LPP20 family lipoprotein [Oceanospirillum sanctuarii]